jgi:nucleoside-diphosphate-sugar epimerase
MVVHLAARVHVMKDNATDPLTAYREVNLIGTEHLARMAANIGVKRFIYMSSVKVLGDGKPFPYTEWDTPAPEDPYGISKWEAEQAINKIAAETELKAVVLRAPLVYGPQVKANYLNLLKLVKRGLPLPVGAINNRRSMIYIGNMVNTIITCLEHPAATGETFIVSDGNDVSTPQLICMIASAMGKDPRLLSFPPSLLKLLGKVAGKSAEVERLTGSLCVDISKIRRTLNWKPPFSMEEGIRETVNWFMEQT